MDKTFSIAPASLAPLIFVASIGIILLVLLGIITSIGYSLKNVKFEVSEQGLRIRPALYGRFIPREEITLEGVKVIDLNVNSEYKPRLRTNGVGLPGYSEGWFKLRNKEKALLFVTDNSNVVYIPTKQDYSVLLSVSNPEEFYESIKQWK